MTERLPLPTLFSDALVAFTIEFDNEAEHRLPHRTTNQHPTGISLKNPWLVSLVLWFNCMPYVTDEGITARDLERLARTKTNLNGMVRWGYVYLEGDAVGGRSHLIRPTRAGWKAQEVWLPLLDVIEARWRLRFGEKEIAELRRLLAALIGQNGSRAAGLPADSRLWAVQPGTCEGAAVGCQICRVRAAAAVPALKGVAGVCARLRSRAVLEAEAAPSLAISANVLRVRGGEPALVRDLPRLTGVSKEAVAVSLS